MSFGFFWWLLVVELRISPARAVWVEDRNAEVCDVAVFDDVFQRKHWAHVPALVARRNRLSEAASR